MSEDREKPEENLGKGIDNSLDVKGRGIDVSDFHGENDLESDIVDLKRRMDKTDEELKAVTGAMRSTLMDVRNLIQELDNPFNLLKDMGVDGLVDKAVEEVTEEVKKAQRDKAKRDAVRDDSIEDSLKSKGFREQPPLGVLPREKLMHRKDVLDRSERRQDVGSSRFQARRDYGGGEYYRAGGYGLLGVQEFSEIKERLEQTEEEVKEIHDVMGSLKDVLSALRKEGDGNLDSVINEGLLDSDTVSGSLDSIEGAYYEAYVSLVGDYLVLRMGENGAEQLLLEGLYKGWANTKVVRDIIDNISSRSRSKDENGASSFGFAFMNTEIEDKILLTSLLRNLDKPPCEWSEPTHLFLLLALVTRAREAKVRRP